MVDIVSVPARQPPVARNVGPVFAHMHYGCPESRPVAASGGTEQDLNNRFRRHNLCALRFWHCDCSKVSVLMNLRRRVAAMDKGVQAYHTNVRQA
jgi:hypothetical protein